MLGDSSQIETLQVYQAPNGQLVEVTEVSNTSSQSKKTAPSSSMPAHRQLRMNRATTKSGMIAILLYILN